jgi:hypothetical protein
VHEGRRYQIEGSATGVEGRQGEQQQDRQEIQEVAISKKHIAGRQRQVYMNIYIFPVTSRDLKDPHQPTFPTWERGRKHTFEETFRFLRTYAPSRTFRQKLLGSVLLVQNFSGMDFENLPFPSTT